MNAKEHAEVWSRAAESVRAMDPRRQWFSQGQVSPSSSQIFGPTFTQQEAAIWDGYAVAAAALQAIANEYHAAANAASSPAPQPPEDQTRELPQAQSVPPQ